MLPEHWGFHVNSKEGALFGLQYNKLCVEHRSQDLRSCAYYLMPNRLTSQSKLWNGGVLKEKVTSSNKHNFPK